MSAFKWTIASQAIVAAFIILVAFRHDITTGTLLAEQYLDWFLLPEP